MAGIGYLFTREFYQLAKRRLAPKGIMCQWLQLYRIFPSDVKLMLRTFHQSFPYVTIWTTIQGDLVMVGSLEPFQLDYKTLTQRMAAPRVREALAAVHIDRPEVLLRLFWLGNREIE